MNPMLFSLYVLRGLILFVFFALVAVIALPFVVTSLAREAHGIVIPGSVYHKSEYARVQYSEWDLTRKVTIEYTVPETSSAAFFDVHLDALQYDALHTKQAVQIRYLPRKDVPDVPGANILWQLHALTIARLENIQGVSRLDALRTPRAILICEILGGILALFILWRITRRQPFAWGAGILGLALLALLTLSGFPGTTLPPVRDVRHTAGRVTQIGRIDKLFAGSRSRGMIADQPVEVVSVEFIPEGRTEAVVAVDLIDHGSVPGLKEEAIVPITYEAAAPRTAYIDGASRNFPERNFSGAITGALLSVAVVVILLVLVHLLGRGYRRLVARAR